MSLKDCVNRAVAGGEMDKARADQIVSEYDNSFQELRQHMGHTQAEAEAARSVVAQAKRDAFEKRRVTQLQAAAVGEQMRRMSEEFFEDIPVRRNKLQKILSFIKNFFIDIEFIIFIVICTFPNTNKFI